MKKILTGKMKSRDEILKAKEDVINHIHDSFEKARALPVGTIKKRGQNNFIKTANGWKYHSRANKKSGESQDDRADRAMADIDAQESRSSASSGSEIKQTRVAEPGTKDSKYAGQLNREGIKGLLTTEGKKGFEDALKEMTATGRGIALRNYTNALANDAGKARGYKRIPDERRMGVGITIKNLQKKYNGTTTAKWGNKEVKISPQDKMTINGKIVEVNNDSKYVKLGGGGRGSASGGFYPSDHFDGQLQGNDYTFAANRIMHQLREGKSPKEIQRENKDRRGFKEVLDHLGLK